MTVESRCRGVVLDRRSGRLILLASLLTFHKDALDFVAELKLTREQREKYLRIRTSRTRHVTFGDGEELGAARYEQIYRAFDAARVDFDWQAGDVAVLDNRLFAHGRDAYEGDRIVVTAFGDSARLETLQPPSVQDLTIKESVR
jgi:hypothetical protein